jgi:hypothetical protein
MIKSIKELKDIHRDEDIYVIGAGASVDYINESFFDGKITIGTNQVYKKIKCDYLVRKETKFLKQALNTGSKVIVSEYDSGNLDTGQFKLNTNKIDHENLYYFEHLDNLHDKVDTSVIGTDKLVVSYSTITSALHLAAYMGAFNIYLVGHDCGSLNGKMTFDKYYDSINDTPWQNWNQYKSWLKIIESQTVSVRNKLVEVYECNVVSINPFVSLNLENNLFM